LSGIQNATRSLIKASVIENKLLPANAQVSEPEDTFDYGGGAYTPPYDLYALLKFPEYSNILGECIDAYKNNITGFGWEIVPVIDTNSTSYDKKLEAVALQQKEEAELLFHYANYKESFTQLTKKVVDNRERNGNAYLEVIENVNGVPCGFEFVNNSSKVRILKPINAVDISMEVKYGEGRKKTKNMTIPVRFHRYAMNDGGKRIFFKEYGDPRPMDKHTGEYGDSINEENKASCLIHFKIESIYNHYGVPRYIGKVPSIVGSRKSEELNISFFDNGRIVPAAILIENGQLTQEAHDAISELHGNAKAFRFLLLEAESFQEDDSIVESENKRNSNVKIDVKPLTELIQQDGLFQDYDKNNRNKIRSSYRIPPIYTGESQDYSKSTAQTARAVAEALVFEPERQELSEPFNRILRDLGYDLVEFRFKSPKLTDKYELSKALAPYITSGVATPNTLVEALSDLLGRKMNVIEEEWGDLPLSMTIKKMEIESIASRIGGALVDEPEEEIEEGEVQKSNNFSKQEVTTILKEVLYEIKKVAEYEED
jgi:PBSX family phage portal protein